MQLSTETMRSSLEADWKMLSPEATELLIGTSLEPRAASKSMLQVIQSKDNPSRCSCAQVAPEEYEANISCCARGTELVFTWRKDGSFEVSGTFPMQAAERNMWVKLYLFVPHHNFSSLVAT
jgi:hypothetical protein